MPAPAKPHPAPAAGPAATPRVLVVGGANLDLLAHGLAPLVAGDSNPARFTETPGGVARNIAERLAQLGVPVALLSAVGDDAAGRTIRRQGQAAGIDMAGVAMWPGHGTARYVALLQPDGRLLLAANDMAIAQALTPAWLQPQAGALRQARCVVLEANLPADTLAAVPALLDAAPHATTAPPPLWADAVSVAKCERLRPLLPRLHTLKANRHEAAQLAGCPADTPPRQVAEALHAQGLAQLALSLGADGLLLSRRLADGRPLQHHHRAPPLPSGAQVNGAGDALLAGLLQATLAEGTGPGGGATDHAVDHAAGHAADHGRPDTPDRLAALAERAVACAARALTGLSLSPPPAAG